MKKYSKNTAETLVTFHIGRGGRFHNQGHKTYCDQDMTISSYTDHLFMGFENEREVIKKIQGYNPDIILDVFYDSLANGDADILNEFGIEKDELGDYGYKDHNGNFLLKEGSDTGCLEEDGEYNTTIVMHLEECDDDELRLILESNSYVSSDVLDFCKEKLGIEEENEEENE